MKGEGLAPPTLCEDGHYPNKYGFFTLPLTFDL